MSNRPCCAWCAAPAPRDVDQKRDHVFADETIFDAIRRLAGNRKCIRRSYSASVGVASVNGRAIQGHLVVSLEPEGGPSFTLGRDPFCTLQCAEAFARAAYVGGFRKSRNREVVT
jgi:hypothetical protein